MIGIKEIISSLGGNLFKGATDLIDEVVTSKEEKALLNIKLQELTNSHVKEIAEEANREIEAYLKDTQNARERDIQANNSANSSWLAKNITSILALSTTVLTFGIFFYVFRATIDTVNKDIIIYVLGALTAIMGQTFSYYFGSTKRETANSGAGNQINIQNPIK